MPFAQKLREVADEQDIRNRQALSCDEHIGWCQSSFNSRQMELIGSSHARMAIPRQSLDAEQIDLYFTCKHEVCIEK